MAATLIDPYLIFLTGESFHRACQVLFQAAKQGVVIRQLVISVNGAFALETYLKCLLFLQKGTPTRGHDLKLLYGALDSGTKAILQREFPLATADSSEFKAARASGVKTDLDSLLESGRRAFETFRYAFEKDLKNTHFALGTLNPLVRAEILKLHPEWEAKSNEG